VTLHRRDLVSLFFGLVFTLCGLAFLNRSEDWDVFDSGGLLAFGLVAIGVLGVLLVLTGARRGGATADSTATDPTATDPTATDPTATGPTATGPNGDFSDTEPPSGDADLNLPGFDDPYGPLDQDDPS
jgi:hypothetical protein